MRLPCMWGRYKDDNPRTNLFAVIVTPAASGKGCIDDIRYLTDHYDLLLRIESERDEQEYLQALEE